MRSPEVLIIGAGPAGIAAALRLARAGVHVLVLEAASYAGAENWSGAIYHAEALLRPDVLGRDLWQEAPTERKIIARSLWVHDGVTAAGFEARANAGNGYGEAWSVLRPKIDRWLAARAIDFGVTLLTGTTITGLRYDRERVVGANTERGPVEAPVVFLAEGDASGLVAREGLERDGRRPRFAQGIKAVFRLSPPEIERRFNVGPGDGVAQEWLLRNGELAGRSVTLDATAFLYTNQESLSLGLVLPLDRLAAHGVADHPHLYRRLLALPGIRELIASAEQVAYGAKVIRAGGVPETPVWVRDGLAVGGGSLGLGMEFPYPNFMGPANTTGLCFADAVLQLRAEGSDFTADALERSYSRRVRDTVDYANAQLFRHWPDAIHGPLLFEQLPALVGQFVNADSLGRHEARAQRRRALAMQLKHLREDLAQAPGLLRGLRTRKPDESMPPLDVRFVALGNNGTREIPASVDPLLQISAEALGHFYGRGHADMRTRLALVRRVLLLRSPGSLFSIARLAIATAAGAAGLVRDLLAYKVRKLPLPALLARPYHAHAAASTRALDWLALQRESLSPATWLAPLDRPHPDVRHITLPKVDVATAKRLHNVCPAEVYSLLSRLGGAGSQYENCIKCESCRVSVPGLDWNRTSKHRLNYRVPGDGRHGLDASASTTLLPQPVPSANISAGDRVLLAQLLRSLATRPAIVGADSIAAWRESIALLSSGVPAGLQARLLTWLDRHAYGWIERELIALLGVPPLASEMRTRAEHAVRRQEKRWKAWSAFFRPSRLWELVARGWQPDEERTLLDWIDDARVKPEEALAWLAEESPSLAWVAANHFLAEAIVGHALTKNLAAPVGRLPDGASQWVPAVAHYVDMAGATFSPSAAIAHGAGLDAARPVRFTLPAGALPLRVTPEFARCALALAVGMARSLRRRALAYAGSRVQFRGEMKDGEGRDTIAKFGAVKAMLAGIEQAVQALESAREFCEREPLRVMQLVHRRMGLRIDAVPWMAGQIFGGMAYSEEDILAPRYRDAFVLSQWPCGVEQDPEAGSLFASALAFGADLVSARNLTTLTAAQLERPEVAPRSAGTSTGSGFANTQRGRPLIWNSGEKFAYRSGAFINGVLLTPAELLTPEHFRRDPRLRSTRSETLRLIRSGFRSPTRGEPYGRYIDRMHGVPPEDVERLRAFNAFATIVPAHLGGKGWSKADYAVLNIITMGLGDASLGLLIMASTSIGTMPVLLALQQDLPRLERELASCLADAAPWDALVHEINVLIAALEHPEPKALKAGFTRLGERAQKMFMGRGSALKYLARDFLLLLQKTVETAKTRDLDAMALKLALLRDQLPVLYDTLVREQAAIPVRREAHERFVRFLATGQISAFALTEPGAGSDTGGVQTRAVLREVPAAPDENGCYQFTPHGARDPRVLLDADRLKFEGRYARYRLPSGELALLDDTDWDLARNLGERRIRAAQSTFVYHDIGCVQKREQGWVYAYWEITGNKMWITNGSIADRYCLYAQTEHGETGFMLERRSEGLRIGPNENKLGQRASPTNELTLDRVRVSAEQIIGFRGHGQVNALETLSVGRGGLVMACATMLERLLCFHPELWSRHADHRATAQFELDRLQTLAARLVGLMDRADLGAGDFRIEAALSKYLASEGLHRVLGWLESIRGPQAAATEELIEKWRRDARILNIYEGTNEVQRFLVLKDLPSLLSGFSGTTAGTTGNDALDAALRAFRDFCAPRLSALKACVWTDPDLQLAWFPVVDWAGELYVWCAMQERVRLLETNDDPADETTVSRLRGMIERQGAYVTRVAESVTADFARTATGADIATATLGIARSMLNATDGSTDAPVCIDALDGVWHVILRSRLEWNAGRAAWAGWHPADLAVLDRLLRWRDGSPALVVKVAALVPEGFDDHLRRLQAAGAEVHIVHQDLGQDDPVALGSILAKAWPAANRIALGCRSGSAMDELFAQALSGALGVNVLKNVAAIGTIRRGEWIEDEAFRRHYLARQREALFVWDPKPDGRSDAFSVADWVTALRTPALPIIGRLPAPGTPQPLKPVPTADVPAAFPDPRSLAGWLRARLRGVAPEPRALLASTRPAPAPVLWIASASTLSRSRSAPGLALIQDLDLPFSVVALGRDDAPPKVASGLAQSGCSGIWHIPHGLRAAPDEIAALINELPPADFVVVDGEFAALAGAIAARRKQRLYAPVVRLDPRIIAVVSGDAQCECPRPATGVLIADTGYRNPILSDIEGTLALASVQFAPKRSSLAHWSRVTSDRPAGLANAPIVIDLGVAVDLEAYEKWVLPLRELLVSLSGREVEIGGTRKITQDVKLLPTAQQIGQTGIAITPEIVLALGVSGAPQHMIGIAKTAAVVAINRDSHAPIFRWQSENGGPHVIKCVGELQEWLPALLADLAVEGRSDSPTGEIKAVLAEKAV